MWKFIYFSCGLKTIYVFINLAEGDQQIEKIRGENTIMLIL
jgi:hypothetical protein